MSFLIYVLVQFWTIHYWVKNEGREFPTDGTDGNRLRSDCAIWVSESSIPPPKHNLHNDVGIEGAVKGGCVLTPMCNMGLQWPNNQLTNRPTALTGVLEMLLQLKTNIFPGLLCKNGQIPDKSFSCRTFTSPLLSSPTWYSTAIFKVRFNLLNSCRPVRICAFEYFPVLGNWIQHSEVHMYFTSRAVGGRGGGKGGPPCTTPAVRNGAAKLRRRGARIKCFEHI